jgi:pilus assembly protein Flp/PilA
MKTLFQRAHIELFLMPERVRDLRKTIRDLRENKSGAAMIEYSILIGLITALVIGTIVTVGQRVATAWTTLNTNMTSMPTS